MNLNELSWDSDSAMEMQMLRRRTAMGRLIRKALIQIPVRLKVTVRHSGLVSQKEWGSVSATAE